MQFDAQQHAEMMGSMLIDNALEEAPLFSFENPRKDMETIIHKILQSSPPSHDLISDAEDSGVEVSELFADTATTAEKLRVIRRYLKDKVGDTPSPPQAHQSRPEVDEINDSLMGLSITNFGQISNRQLHEKLLALTQSARGLPKEAQMVIDHVMLLRAKERYLFDCAVNREVVSDDPWLQDLWDWVAGRSPNTSCCARS